MPLTRPIPDEAMPVVEILRRDVPRPKELPKLIEGGPDGPRLRWSRSLYESACPMGLHPRSRTEQPCSALSFLGVDGPTNIEVHAFGKHFDEQTDPLAVVNAIWGEEE